MQKTHSDTNIFIRDTEIVSTDTPQQYRQKLSRIALNEMYQFVAILDVEGTLLEVNRAALEGAGLTLADVEGRPFWKCFWWAVSTEIQDTLKAAIVRAAQGEFVRYDVEVYGRAGGKATIIIDFSMTPVKDNTGKVVFIVPEGRDITEKKSYEREIAQKNAELQTLLEHVNILDGIIEELRLPAPAQRAGEPGHPIHGSDQAATLNELFERTPSFMAVLRGPNHVFEFANHAYFKLVGHRDIVGKPLNEALPEIKQQGFIDLLDKVLATAEPFTGSGTPVLVQREPGAPLEQRYLDFVYQPLFGINNVVSGVFVEGHDVTEQKQAEETLRKADKRKDEFLATLAHELRNPLAPIRHAAIISQTAGVSEAELKWSHEIIAKQVEHMGRLLDDLLDVSRITSGKLELRKERLSLNDSLFSAVETARPMIEARGHQLTITVPGIPSYIDADPVRFEQIFSNLLTNAAKYTDCGGHIRVSAELGEGIVRITVQDNGIGISQEQLPSVFEMFSQATSALHRSEGGLGIGLSLVHGLVLLHGGTVGAHSMGIGCGSEFSVTLPLAPDLKPLVEPSKIYSGESVAVPKSLRVLVVDDNRDNADLCTMLFKKSGHEVRTAYSGPEALAIAAEFPPQFVLLDIGMPEMNGYEVARRLRSTKGGKEIMLVAATGWGQEDDKQQAQAAGFDLHVTKPFDFKVLKELLAQWGNISNFNSTIYD